MLLNGKRQNLEYGAAADAPAVFLNDLEFTALWTSPDRYYFVASQQGAERIENLVGQEHFETISSSRGKLLLRNVPPPNNRVPEPVSGMPSTPPIRRQFSTSTDYQQYKLRGEL